MIMGTKCFFCQKKFNKKDAFTIEMNVFEGKIKKQACPSCAENLNELLKDIEDIHNEQK